MRIVLAPNAFKGSLTATRAAAAMALGVARALPDAEVEHIPLSDGGDGLHEVALELFRGDEVSVTVTGPRFDLIEAGFVFDSARDMAIIEMARASGLALLHEDERDPTRTTTRGTGELMNAALDAGALHLLIGIGGSATNDGGIGMAAALGWRFLDENGDQVTPAGGELERIVSLDGAGRDPRVAKARIEVACDVDNPLCGPQGAAVTYGPQKGATPPQVEALDRGLAHLADLVASAARSDDRDMPGAGAAGGLGFGLRAFAGGTLRRGTDLIFEALGLEERLAGADLVITGEGCIDAQTLRGKAPAEVARRARDRGIPCYAVAGRLEIGAEELRECGIAGVFTLGAEPRCREATMADAARHVERVTADAVTAFRDARDSGN